MQRRRLLSETSACAITVALAVTTMVLLSAEDAAAQVVICGRPRLARDILTF
jgi:hypothetical protein